MKRSFGPVTIEYGKVQSKVSLKYDSWHKDALAKFSALLSSCMTEFHAEVAKVSPYAAVISLENMTLFCIFCISYICEIIVSFF